MKIIIETKNDEDWYWKNLETLPDDSDTIFANKKERCKFTDEEIKQMWDKIWDEVLKKHEKDRC